MKQLKTIAQSGAQTQKEDLLHIKFVVEVGVRVFSCGSKSNAQIFLVGHSDCYTCYENFQLSR